MGLAAVLHRLVETELGRRAIRNLHMAAILDTQGERQQRRTHLRTAVRQARRALANDEGPH
jgi:hypothetical protein